MRWWIALPLVLACSHAPVAEPREASSTNPAHALPADLARAHSVADAIARPVNKPVVLLGFLCEDRSANKCPACPDQGDCPPCEGPSWLFCDNRGASDASSSLRVIEPPPGYKLSVGQRYLVKGVKTDTREMALETIYYADAE